MNPALLGVLAAWPLVGSAAPPPDAAAVTRPAPHSDTLGGRTFDVPADAGADRRTLPNFFGNATRNVAGVWSGGSVRPLLIGASFAGLAAFADHPAQRYFEDNPMRDLGRAGGKSGGAALVAGSSLALLGLSQTVGGDRFRAAAYDTSQAVLVNTLYTFALKSSTRRWRPDGSNRMSFPSGHTSNAFAIATVWSRQYGTSAAVPGYLLASLVGVSRMATQKHHLSDVVAGATLGYLVGSSVARGNGGRVEPDRRRLSLAVDGGPSGDGVGLALRVDLSPRH
jgi:membrane-associated phospholipid phosphatase